MALKLLQYGYRLVNKSKNIESFSSFYSRFHSKKKNNSSFPSYDVETEKKHRYKSYNSIANLKIKKNKIECKYYKSGQYWPCWLSYLWQTTRVL